MRNLCGLIFLAGALVVIGCGKEQKPEQPPAPAAPVQSASQPNRDGYLGTLVRGQKTAVKGIDTAALNQEVQLFNVQEGRLPKDLNELVAKQYLGKLPEAPVGMRLNYDAVQGKVTVVPQ
jgi:stage V sporulation protein SpoVS